MDQIAASLEQANPQWNKDNRIGVRPLIDHIVGSRTKSWMLMLLGAVGIVLFPLEQGHATGSELAIRTSGDPYDVLPQVKAAVFAVLPDVPLRNIRTLDERIAARIAERKVTMLLLGLFGLLGLVISAVGVYGVMAYLVSQRAREIGVRMALGATRSNVMRMVFVESCALVASGLTLGGIAAWYLRAAAAAFLFRIEPTDPRAFTAAFLILAVAALVTTPIPARRAANADPMIALRTE
jgi:putative ABC transport system permease protein